MVNFSKYLNTNNYIGNIEVSPKSKAVAGSYHTWNFTYKAGRYGIDNGGRIRILYREVSDMGNPQFVNAQDDNYFTVTSSNPNIEFGINYTDNGGWRPFSKCIEINIYNESLAENEYIYITMGDKKEGSKGQKVQTYPAKDFQFITEVECFQSGSWAQLENNMNIPIIAGDPHRLKVLTPSEVSLNDSMYLLIKCEDFWGNPTKKYKGNIKYSIENIKTNEIKLYNVDESNFYSFENNDNGYYRFSNIIFEEPGLYRFKVVGNELQNNIAYSNVFTVYDDNKLLNHYWGDLHSQQNNSTGTGSVEDAFIYARDAAAMDFVGHQPNDFLLTNKGWKEAKKAVEEYHAPGKFIPILGYEWSGNTPSGGDRNVHFLNNDGPLHRSSHWHIDDKSDINSDRYPLDNLYETLQDKDDVILVPHVGGRRCDITKYFNPKLEPVIEICSVHGRFEWLLHEALENGYTVGVTGGSDDHTGRPGDAYPTDSEFGTRGGLTGIYAKELTRDAIFASLKARNTYATTGERIYLHVETEKGKIMGDAWEDTNAPQIHINTAGTKPIEKLEILRNQEVVYSHPIFNSKDYSTDLIRIEWGGALVKGRGRSAIWDGHLSVSDGLIKNAKIFAFDHPYQGISYKDDHQLKWNSTTSGDHDGLIIDLEGTKDTFIHFETSQGKDKIKIRDLKKGPIKRDCGGLGLYYQFSMQPKKSGPLSINANWKDLNPIEGRNAYWIRVTQEDGEMAWSSPLYVDIK